MNERGRKLSPKELPVLGNDLNQCMMCKHLVKVGGHFNANPVGWKCKAFGEIDIPTTIVRGLFDHRIPYRAWKPGIPNDNGIQFEDDSDPETALYTYEDLAGPLPDDHREDDDVEGDE